MKLDDLKHEVTELASDAKYKLKQATVNYTGNSGDQKDNEKKALLGLGIGVVGGILNPCVGVAALTYSGIKAYQSYKDSRRNSKWTQSNKS